VQRVATERPWSPLDQPQAGFIAQQSACGERMRRVEAWREQRRAAGERGQPCRDEPAAHVGGASRANSSLIGFVSCVVSYVVRRLTIRVCMHVTAHFWCRGATTPRGVPSCDLGRDETVVFLHGIP
jgi:hypothetical protein